MSTTHGNERVSDKELIETFEKIEGPFVTASELSNHLPISRAAINKRLKQLWEADRINRKKPTSTMIGWWLPESQECSER
ncbi:HTH domain-containing protein [Halomicroarcula limicola]|uniref:HTH domain-containing protein n=1 Tax=Haloarcula limicola TaxID=1429915 RepID=A0A8J7Y7Z7_9EURY|nr:HTH domain-containing protein [Halomicroarcula limicola]